MNLSFFINFIYGMQIIILSRKSLFILLDEGIGYFIYFYGDSVRNLCLKLIWYSLKKIFANQKAVNSQKLVSW
jgi:hypothetical protein